VEKHILINSKMSLGEPKPILVRKSLEEPNPIVVGKATKNAGNGFSYVKT
jgi:hypothetical protein